MERLGPLKADTSPGKQTVLQPLKKPKRNYLKYGSIYGSKYAVRTDYGKWDSGFTLAELGQFVRRIPSGIEDRWHVHCIF